MLFYLFFYRFSVEVVVYHVACFCVRFSVEVVYHVTCFLCVRFSVQVVVYHVACFCVCEVFNASGCVSCCVFFV